jgi:UDP-N-acetylmuramoyl-L-alanyl-D-glutamate--2,6-diaminopimelate ligase
LNASGVISFAGLSEDLLNQVITIPDRIEAIKEAIRLASGGDIVLVAGKGHEDYQEIKGIRHHMNDIEELRKLLT